MLVNTLSFEATMEDRMFEHENCSGMINLNNEEASEKEPSTLDELENFVEVKVRQLSRTLIKQWLETCEDTQLDPATKCRWCGADANYVSKRVSDCEYQIWLGALPQSLLHLPAMPPKHLSPG